MVSLLCETDFVARNEEFISLARDLCLQVAAMNPTDVGQLEKQEFIRDSSVKVAELVKLKVAKFGENIKIAKFCRLEI